jgi:hypothetical protein
MKGLPLVLLFLCSVLISLADNSIHEAIKMKEVHRCVFEKGNETFHGRNIDNGPNLTSSWQFNHSFEAMLLELAARKAGLKSSVCMRLQLNELNDTLHSIAQNHETFYNRLNDNFQQLSSVVYEFKQAMDSLSLLDHTQHTELSSIFSNKIESCEKAHILLQTLINVIESFINCILAFIIGMCLAKVIRYSSRLFLSCGK